jgi:hypothetical protein
MISYFTFPGGQHKDTSSENFFTKIAERKYWKSHLRSASRPQLQGSAGFMLLWQATFEFHLLPADIHR